MPTPVTAARQCLTQESAAVLDEAVAVARRRGHAQTTSLHMVSSLLSLSNSALREACTRARNNAYSSRVQFKALELSLGVSLDRLPSSQAGKGGPDEPPVSNSLMAAIKRSQANQRRQPENFTFYQQQQQQQQYSSCSSIPVVKVELRNLIMSILDDPLVSRVFGEAGFRSCDIKMATLRPGNSFYPSHMFGCTSRYKRPSPPLFLCNLDSSGDVGGKSFSFPFMSCFSGDENSRRVAEVMLKGKKRCPLLLGTSAGDALRNFIETVQRKVKGVLPDGLDGSSVVCVKDEIFRYLNGDCDEGPFKSKLEEVEGMMNNAGDGGLVVSYGDLNAMAGDDVGVHGVRFLVGKLGRLVEVYGGKLRLIGYATSYEVYFKVLNKFPSMEEVWDLEVLPITSLRFSVGGSSYPRSSLMESFVPLGGFFSMPPETKSPSANARCHLCNEKYEQEAAALSKVGGLRSSVAEQCQSSLLSWLQSAGPGSQSGSPSLKGKDDRLLLNAKITALQRKWDGICEQHQGFKPSLSKGNHFPRILGFQVDEEGRRGKASNASNESSNEPGNKNASSSLSDDLQKSSSLKKLKAVNNPSILSCSGDGGKSPASVTSVTTDLGLGVVQDFPRYISDRPSQSPFSLHHKNHLHSDVKDLKLLQKALLERVDQQEEAISSIVRIISHCQTRNGGASRRNIWISLRGADGLSKKKLGLALAELLYGSSESFIYVDLSFQDDVTHIDKLFNSQLRNSYDITMRGTVVDYLVEKLSRKRAVVFFENIDKADQVVQSTLSRAMKSGRFADLSGREVNVGNCIFLGATRSSDSGNEEDVGSIKGSSIQILIRFDLNDDVPSSESDLLSMNKRKLVGWDRISTNHCRSSEATKRANKASNSNLDLNLPAEGSEVCSTTESNNDSSCENSRSWLEDFDSQADQTVVFEAFDFEAVTEKLFKNVAGCLPDVVGCDCLIEIDPTVMKQLLAAAYLFGNKRVDDWIQDVLRKGFVEAMGEFSFNARTIVKLVTCDGAVSGEQGEGLLPERVTLK